MGMIGRTSLSRTDLFATRGDPGDRRMIGQTSSSRRGLIAADSLLNQTRAGVMISRHARALLPSPLSAFPFCKKLLSNHISGPA